jgi:hypothetical protein
VTTTARAQVDVNIPRFNQAMVALFTGLAFLTQWWPLVAVAAVVLAVTHIAGPHWGLFTQAYVRLIRPRLAGPVETEDAAPPRFSQTLGAVFLGFAVVLFVAGAAVAGWVLTLIVFALAALAATTRIGVGCLLYERVLAR